MSKRPDLVRTHYAGNWGIPIYLPDDARRYILDSAWRDFPKIRFVLGAMAAIFVTQMAITVFSRLLFPSLHRELGLGGAVVIAILITRYLGKRFRGLISDKVAALRGHCPKCGFPIELSVERCPECGSAYYDARHSLTNPAPRGRPCPPPATVETQSPDALRRRGVGRNAQ